MRTDTDPTAKRPPRRRGATRAQLIAAAGDLFSESGSVNVSIDAICERAGFTRGAFYSNFKTVEDVFFAFYQQRSDGIERQLADVIDTIAHLATPQSLESILAVTLQALPADPAWFIVRAGFIGQAQHRAEVAHTLRLNADSFGRQLQPLLLRTLQLAERKLLVTPEVFTQAVIAANVGAITQSPLHEDPTTVREATVRGVISGLTSPQ